MTLPCEVELVQVDGSEGEPGTEGPAQAAERMSTGAAERGTAASASGAARLRVLAKDDNLREICMASVEHDFDELAVL